MHQARFSLKDDMEKVAFRLRVSDIEDQLGTFLSDQDEEVVRRMIADRRNKSFALRHPWLTGIPTLGIAPAVAHGRAVHDITRKMLRRDEKLRAAHAAKRKAQYEAQLEAERLSIERDKANQMSRAAASFSDAISQFASKK
jgi:hypothetical protein